MTLAKAGTTVATTTTTSTGSTLVMFASNAALTILKASAVLSDPIDLSSNPKSIPGAIMVYDIGQIGDQRLQRLRTAARRADHRIDPANAFGRKQRARLTRAGNRRSGQAHLRGLVIAGRCRRGDDQKNPDRGIGCQRLAGRAIGDHRIDTRIMVVVAIAIDGYTPPHSVEAIAGVGHLIRHGRGCTAHRDRCADQGGHGHKPMVAPL